MSNRATKITSQALFASQANQSLNTKGADAFYSTTNPILDLFTETRKSIPETLEEFTALVRKIESAKNHDSELFIKLLKFHRLIEKGNGLKGLYYICMMILKDEDPIIYEKVLAWSRQYPKDILRLARLSSMFGCKSSNSGSIISIPLNLKYSSAQGLGKGVLGKKMTKWALTEKASSNISLDLHTAHTTHTTHTTHTSTMLPTCQMLANSKMHQVVISAEIELYSQLVAEVIKKILTGKMFDDDVNLMLFKYLSYETGHFAVESKLIWTRVQAILESDSVVEASKDEFIALQ
jgi:hypothetical protein